MSRLLQELIDEAVDEAVRKNTEAITIRFATAFLRAGDSAEKVAQATGLPLEKVEALEEMLAADALSEANDR